LADLYFKNRGGADQQEHLSNTTMHVIGSFNWKTKLYVCPLCPGQNEPEALSLSEQTSSVPAKVEGKPLSLSRMGR